MAYNHNKHNKLFSSNPDDFNLLPLDFSQHRLKLTKKNPFTTMTDEDWLEYVSSRKAHFTTKPHYELIPWEKLQVIERDASNAGWELILRTTNNTAYCPPALNYRWYQCTQWIFGYPEYQLLLVLSYTEHKFTLINDTPDDEIELVNYFGLKVVSTTKPKHYTKEDLYDDDELYRDYDEPYYPNNRPKIGDVYYEHIKPAYGWVMNGGILTEGHSNNNYMYVGNKNPNYFGYYHSLNDEPELTKEKRNENKKNRIETMLPSTFWNEWIDNNKDNLIPGKFKENIQITHWSDTYVLPGGGDMCETDIILKWDMSFQFIQKLMDSNITKWLDDVFGYGCCSSVIENVFWSSKIPWKINDYPELHKKVCLLECIPNNSDDKSIDWIPFNGYTMSLFKQKEIKFSNSAKRLIDEVWHHIMKNN